ncbi:MAG: hypothetical protein AAGA37_04300 [Actinomycetota bacterium]
MSEARIELTLQLWSTGAETSFEDYITALTALLPRNRGALVRRVSPLDPNGAEPDAVLVMSFPDRVSIDGFLRDPARGDLEDLAGRAVSQSLITDGRSRSEPTELATLHTLHPERDHPEEVPDAES